MASEEPFVGLRPFSADDAAYFHGRSLERRIVAANLSVARLTLLYGPSGAGKSSLLRAGVKPELEGRGAGATGAAGWPEAVVVVFDGWAGADPLGGLATALNTSMRDVLGVDSPTGAAELRFPELLRAWEERLVAAAAEATPPPPIHVLLDQFEEYFTTRDHTSGSDAFVVEFARAVRDPEIHASFLISIREDAYARLDRFEEDIPDLFSNYIRLDFLNVGSAREAVKQANAGYNRRVESSASPVRIETTLINAVLTAVRRSDETSRPIRADEPLKDTQLVETAYLQLVMSRLWDAVIRDGGRTIDLDRYERLGGASAITRGYLDEAMKSLKRDEQDVMSMAFRHLVTPSGVRIAYSVDDLASYIVAGRSGGRRKTRRDLERGLKKLVPRRVISRVEPGVSKHQPVVYEVYHDVLVESIRHYLEQRSQVDRPDEVSFSALVTAQFRMGVAMRAVTGDPVRVEAQFRALLRRFEALEGRVIAAYWGSDHPAAAAVVEAPPDRRPTGGRRTGYRLQIIAPAAVQKDAEVTALLHRCRLLGDEVAPLGPRPARDLLEAIAAVAGQLIALTDRTPARRVRDEILAAQRAALDDIAQRARLEAARADRVTSWQAQSVLGVLMLLFGVGLLYSIVAVWPAVEAGAQGTAAPTVSWFGVSYDPSPGAALLTVAVLAGALGSYLHATVSFTDYIGNQRLAKSWVPWYPLRLAVGASLGALTYLALRGTVLWSADSTGISPYGIAAVAGVAGLCAKQAFDKLREVGDAALVGHLREASSKYGLIRPVPILTAVEPSALRPGESTLVLVGAGFVSGSVVRVARLDAPDRDVPVASTEPQRLAVTLPDDVVKTPGTFAVFVANPRPGGGVSRGLTVTVAASGA